MIHTTPSPSHASLMPTRVEVQTAHCRQVDRIAIQCVSKDGRKMWLLIDNGPKPFHEDYDKLWFSSQSNPKGNLVPH